MDPEQALAQARKAWLERREANREMSRLRSYRGMTPGMKDDFRRQSQKYDRAEQVLSAILGGAQ